MELTTTQAIKTTLIIATGLSRDALHIYFGLAVLLISAVILRKPLRSYVPWVAVWVMAIAAEMLDMRDDLMLYDHWRWDASMHDVLNTMFWPTVLMLLARHSHFFSGHHALPRRRRTGKPPKD